LKASLKAVIVNRIGDAALVIATALSLHYFGTIEF
jgi:NADH:ubiquinone oxidoreductase subunit 5 (subunit L)/multisubunit Na+/H+ antiporter MnhA subunit